MGYIFTIVNMGLLWNNGPSKGRRNNGPYTGRRHNGPSTGRIINGPSTGRMIGWPNMANNRPHYGRKWARVEIVRSWADHNGPSLIGRI